jgi:hypothetical protein
VRSLRGPVGEEAGGQDGESLAHARLTKACSRITAGIASTSANLLGQDLQRPQFRRRARPVSRRRRTTSATSTRCGRFLT